jgi:hypothetical protein
MIDLRQYISGLLSGLQARRKRARLPTANAFSIKPLPAAYWWFQVFGRKKRPTSTSQRRARLYQVSWNRKVDFGAQRITIQRSLKLRAGVEWYMTTAKTEKRVQAIPLTPAIVKGLILSARPTRLLDLLGA